MSGCGTDAFCGGGGGARGGKAVSAIWFGLVFLFNTELRRNGDALSARSKKQEVKVASPVTACSSFVLLALSLSAILVWSSCGVAVFDVHNYNFVIFSYRDMLQVRLF